MKLSLKMADALIIHEVQTLVNKISDIIKTVTPLVEQSASTFVKNSVKKLALIGAYHKCFKTLSVKSREEADQLWEKHLIRNANVEEVIDTLLDKEKEFDDFLEEIDIKWRNEVTSERNMDKALNVGDQLPPNLKATNTENRYTDLSHFFVQKYHFRIIKIQKNDSLRLFTNFEISCA